MASEGETPIIKKKSTEISFDKKMANKAGEGFILTTNFYKSTNDAALLDLKKRNMEGMAAIHMEGMAANK